jgi:hypothetical protein
MKPLLPPRWAGAVAAVLVSNLLIHLPLFAAEAANLSKNPSTETTSELPYHSVFKHYQRHTDVAITPWQQSNQVVTERGGWRAYAQEASVHEAPHDAQAGSGSSHDHTASPPAGSAP